MSAWLSAPRRTFLQALAAGLLRLVLPRASSAAEPPRRPQPNAPKPGQYKLPAGGQMPMRRLGRTDQMVSLIGLGGFHLGLPRTDAEAASLIHYAIDHGVTFVDNCWDYNGGKSEDRVGQAMAGGYREKAFLMTKLDGRDRRSATAQLEQSLKRLRTDRIDLVQIHEVIRMNDPERVFGSDGAIAALVDAQKAGKLRYIGFTGHKSPAIHLHMLEVAAAHGFVFDAVQMPVNVMDAHYESFAKQVIPVLQKSDIGVLGMKPIGSGLILQSGVVSAPECLRYAMSQPTSVVITGCETQGVLEQALFAAYTFKPYNAEETRSLLARTAAPAADGHYEQFKTSTRFDGTTSHPWWLESASEQKPG